MCVIQWAVVSFIRISVLEATLYLRVWMKLQYFSVWIKFGTGDIHIIYIQSNEIHNVVALIKFLLVLRFQLYMFRTITVHPQELLCRYCVLVDKHTQQTYVTTSFHKTWLITHTSPTLYYSTYHSLHIQYLQEAPEDGPLRSETCRADT